MQGLKPIRHQVVLREENYVSKQLCMIQRHLLFILFLSLLFIGCQDRHREEQLAQREKNLLERERLFSFKEKEYQSLLHMRDSLLAIKKPDSMVSVWPDSLVGLWKSKVICRASNCNDYVIGDKRTDNWEFITDSTGMIAKMRSANNAHTRIFSGNMLHTEVRLHYITDSAAQRKVDMKLVLQPLKQDFLSGTQVIEINNSCTATFDIELVRASNN